MHCGTYYSVNGQTVLGTGFFTFYISAKVHVDVHVVLSTIGKKGKIKKAAGKKDESLRPGVDITPLMPQP